MIVNECNPWLCMTLDATLSNRSKELCCTCSPFLMPPLSSSPRLPTFLNHPSPVWWAPLSSAPYTNEQSLYACLMVFCISLSVVPSSPLIPVQNPCMETLQINLCSTAVPVEQPSTESPSMGTGQRRFIPKTIHVSTNSSALLLQCPAVVGNYFLFLEKIKVHTFKPF